MYKTYDDEKRFITDDIHTITSESQIECENECLQAHSISNLESTTIHPPFKRTLHLSYVLKGLGPLKWYFNSLDSSRTWLCYWNLHSLDLLTLGKVKKCLTSIQINSIIDFLGNRCQIKNNNVNNNTNNNENNYKYGGFGGGPQQLPHCASTYAAVNALITLGNVKPTDDFQ